MKSSVFSRIVFWLALVVTLLLFVYATVAAVGNVMGVYEFTKALETSFSVFGLVWSAFTILMPLIVLIIMVLIGWGKQPLPRLLLLFAGLTIVSVWQLNMLHFVPVTALLA